MEKVVKASWLWLTDSFDSAWFGGWVVLYRSDEAFFPQRFSSNPLHQQNKPTKHSPQNQTFQVRMDQRNEAKQTRFTYHLTPNDSFPAPTKMWADPLYSSPLGNLECTCCCCCLRNALRLRWHSHSTFPTGSPSNPRRLWPVCSRPGWPVPLWDRCLQTTFGCARLGHDGVFLKTLTDH